MATATTVVKETTPKYLPVLNADAAEVIKGIYSTLDKISGIRAELREANKEYNERLLGLPSLWFASDSHREDGMSAKSIAALAGRDDEQQVRYYIQGGRVMANLVNDGKTSPASIMTQVNKAARQGNGVTASRVNAIIERLEESGGTWADFVTAVKELSDNPSTRTESALSVLEKAESFDAGQLARLQLLVQKHTK